MDHIYNTKAASMFKISVNYRTANEQLSSKSCQMFLVNLQNKRN